MTLNISNYYKDRWYLFALYNLLGILCLYLINDVIITDPQYFTGGNENSIKLFRNVYKVIYFLYPIYALFRVLFFSFVIRLGVSLFTNISIEFKQIFTLVIIAELVFLIPDFIEVIWFLLLKTDYSMFDVKHFSFLSLYNLFDPQEIPDGYTYLLKLINIFEITYWIILIFGLKQITNKPTLKSFKVVAGSYGSILLIITLFKLIVFSSILE